MPRSFRYSRFGGAVESDEQVEVAVAIEVGGGVRQGPAGGDVLLIRLEGDLLKTGEGCRQDGGEDEGEGADAHGTIIDNRAALSPDRGPAPA